MYSRPRPSQSAIVIVCDLEKYSKLSARKQLLAFQGIQEVVRSALSIPPNARPPPHQPVIPTGDGVIACLLADDGPLPTMQQANRRPHLCNPDPAASIDRTLGGRKPLILEMINVNPRARLRTGAFVPTLAQ